MRVRARLVGVAVVAAVLGAACGGDDGAGSSTGQTLDQAVAQGVNSALNGSASSAPSATTTTLPQSLEQWEALADQQRAAIVARIEDNGWGKSPDGTTVTGPEGFTIDLTTCPAGWSETEGLTDTTIKIGHTGWWIMGGGVRDLGSTAEDGNPYIQWARQTLAASGIDYHTSANFGLGFEYAFPIVQALRIAGELDGGLTRTNLMLALRTMDMTNPMLLPGVQFNLDGNKDGYFIEGSDISQFDSARQQWVQQGPVIDLSGQSQNCAFDQATQTCR